MRRVLVARLRPFVLVAALASLLLNLAQLVPSLYMLQVFERVFGSRGVETLVMLSLCAAGALARAGRALEERLADMLIGGDGSDVVEGQAGDDTLLFNRANIAENINISANGGRVLSTRNVANVSTDLNDVENIHFNALGGADNIVVGDLSATDVKQVRLDLAGALGGSTGDGQADTVTINGTGGDDGIQLTMVNGALVVDGLASRIVIDHFDPALDTIRILGLGGDDAIDASGLQGGDGDDVLIGGAGDDIAIGGGGADVIVNDLTQAVPTVASGLFAWPALVRRWPRPAPGGHPTGCRRCAPAPPRCAPCPAARRRPAAALRRAGGAWCWPGG